MVAAGRDSNSRRWQHRQRSCNESNSKQSKAAAYEVLAVGHLMLQVVLLQAY
jgi:hypothetical protein